MSKGLEALKEINVWTYLSNPKIFEEKCFIIKKELIALEIIIGSGLSLEHCILIAKSNGYEDYDAQFDVFMKKKYQPFRFELRKSKEQYELLKEVLL